MSYHIVDRDTGIMLNSANQLSYCMEDLQQICESIMDVLERVSPDMQDESGQGVIEVVCEQIKSIQADIAKTDRVRRALSGSAATLNELEYGDHYIRADEDKLQYFVQKLQDTMKLVSQEYEENESVITRTQNELTNRLQNAQAEYNDKERAYQEAVRRYDDAVREYHFTEQKRYEAKDRMIRAEQDYENANNTYIRCEQDHQAAVKNTQIANDHCVSAEASVKNAENFVHEKNAAVDFANAQMANAQDEASRQAAAAAYNTAIGQAQKAKLQLDAAQREFEAAKGEYAQAVNQEAVANNKLQQANAERQRCMQERATARKEYEDWDYRYGKALQEMNRAKDDMDRAKAEMDEAKRKLDIITGVNNDYKMYCMQFKSNQQMYMHEFESLIRESVRFFEHYLDTLRISTGIIYRELAD